MYAPMLIRRVIANTHGNTGFEDNRSPQVYVESRDVKRSTVTNKSRVGAVLPAPLICVEQATVVLCGCCIVRSLSTRSSTTRDERALLCLQHHRKRDII